MTQSGAVTGGGFSSITLKRLRAGLVLMLSATLGITANASAETSKTFTPGAGSEQPSLELAGVCSRDLTENCGAVSDSAEARVSCSGLAGRGARLGAPLWLGPQRWPYSCSASWPERRQSGSTHPAGSCVMSRTDPIRSGQSRGLLLDQLDASRSDVVSRAR